MDKKKVIGAALAVLALLVCLFFGVRTVAAGLVYPLENAAAKISGFCRTRVCGIFQAQAAAARLAVLERENENLRLVRADNENLRAENERLQGALGFAVRKTKQDWLAARVLSVGGTTGTRLFLRIDQGARKGVRKGACVVAPEGLVGQVYDVGPNEAMVLPITDAALRVPCRIKTPDPAAGALYGILYGNGAYARAAGKAFLIYGVNPLRLGHVGQNAAFGVPSRAQVVTSGLGGVYPPGILVGFLLDGTSEDDTRLERQGDVAPAVDFSALQYVFIRREE